MKIKQSSFKWIISSFLLTASVPTIISTTSCAKTNPYQDIKVGDELKIDSSKDANYAKEIAKTRIDTSWNGNSIKWEDFDNKGSKYISTQIYWEIVYKIASDFSKKNKPSISKIELDENGSFINPITSATFACNFLSEFTITNIKNNDSFTSLDVKTSSKWQYIKDQSTYKCNLDDLSWNSYLFFNVF
ncbi:MAG: hypothetical protein LBL60_01880 [Mycoplasmataceae bacterium]|nr:hypothetical protein [Mycoplasmataceae bacterium]